MANIIPALDSFYRGDFDPRGLALKKYTLTKVICYAQYEKMQIIQRGSNEDPQIDLELNYLNLSLRFINPETEECLKKLDKICSHPNYVYFLVPTGEFKNLNEVPAYNVVRCTNHNVSLDTSTLQVHYSKPIWAGAPNALSGFVPSGLITFLKDHAGRVRYLNTPSQSLD